MLTVRIEQDPDVENPCGWDAHWRLHSFGRRHSNFKHPAELGLGPLDRYGDPQVRDKKLQRKLDAGLAFLLSYYEHGECLWYLRSGTSVMCRFDGVNVAGLLIWPHAASHLGAKTFEQRAADAAAFLQTYTDWANGHTYWYSIEDEAGETVDSCGGWIGDAAMVEQIAEQLVGREFRVVGFDWLEDTVRQAVAKLATTTEA